MKPYILFLFTVLLFSACKDDDSSSVNDQLLDPQVAVAKEFVDHLKKNERFYVLTLVKNYNPDKIDDPTKKQYDDRYAKLEAYTRRYKLKPLNKWIIALDTAHGRTTDYFVCFKNVLVPFEKYPEGNDPVYLQITFDGQTNSDQVIDFHVILRENCSHNDSAMNLIHGFTERQEYYLAQ